MVIPNSGPKIDANNRLPKEKFPVDCLPIPESLPIYLSLPFRFYSHQIWTRKDTRPRRTGKATKNYLYECDLLYHSQQPAKSNYKRLREAGKPVKKAIVAVMRKLVILMNRLLSYPSFELAPEK